MANIVYSAALQAPIALANPTGVLLIPADPPAVVAKTTPVPKEGVVGLVGAPSRLALAMLTGAGAMGLASAAPSVIQRLVTPRQPAAGALATAGVAPVIAQSTPWAVTSLITGINNGVAPFDDHGGNSITWMSDATGGFARVNTNPSGTAQGGTCGLQWTGLDTSKKGLYLKYDLRRTTNAVNSKECKVFGFGYPTNYSDFTWGCNVGGYSGNTPGLSYSDAATGGDINTQFWLYACPTLTGGSSYTRTPHPTVQVQPSSSFAYDVAGNWQTHEVWMLQNDDGTANGEVAQWINGTLVFWATNMWNCRTGGQGFVRVDLFGYTPAPGSLIEDYRNFYASYTRPTGRGI